MNVNFSLDVNKAVEEIISSIGKGIGVAADKILPEYAKYMVAQGIWGIIFGIVFIIAAIILLRAAWKDIQDEDVWGEVGIIIGSVCLICGIIAAFYYSYQTVIWGIAPVGAMTQRVLDAIGSAR